MNFTPKLLCLLSSVLLLLSSTLAQEVVIDSTFGYQFVLPGGFKVNEEKTGSSQKMYVDDNGSSVLIKFEQTSESPQEIARQLNVVTLEKDLSENINSFEKIRIEPSKVDNIEGVDVQYSYKHTQEGRTISLMMIMKMYFWKGFIVNVACTAEKSVFPNYREQFDLVMTSFTHNLAKELYTERYENGQLYIAGTGVALAFPQAPVKDAEFDMLTYSATDDNTNLIYSASIVCDNNFIAADPIRSTYLAEWLSSYNKSMQEQGFKTADTIIGGHRGIFYSYSDKKVLGDNHQYSMTFIVRSTVIILSVTGEKQKLADALNRLIPPVTPHK